MEGSVTPSLAAAHRHMAASLGVKVGAMVVAASKHGERSSGSVMPRVAKAHRRWPTSSTVSRGTRAAVAWAMGW